MPTPDQQTDAPRRDIDRRAVFFFSTGIVCALLIPTALPEFQWVGKVLVIAQGVLGLLSLADHVSHRHRHS
jgi:hypothetical protein